MAEVEYKGEGRATNSGATRAPVWLWLTVPAAVLLAIAAGGGLFVEDLYRDAPYFVAQAVGQDFVTLTIALPVLVTSAIFAGRGSRRAQLVWLGVLTYVLYTYVIAAFAVRFNPLFLVYVALVGLSLYALIWGLTTVDFDGIKARFTQRTPVRAVSVFLVVLATLFYFMWLGETVPVLLLGEVPQSVTDNGTPTNAVHVLDMAWILPAMLLAAIWLWRGQKLGYTLAGILLTFVALLGLAVMAMIVSMSLYGLGVAIAQAAIFGVVAVIVLGMLVWFLRGLKEG